jgi:hypothetical protein
MAKEIPMKRQNRSRGWSALTLVVAFLIVPSIASAQAVTLPPPDPGAFSTTFDFLHDGRLAAYTGDNVYVEQAAGSSNFVLLGGVPAQFQGGSDPAFLLTSPNGLFFVLGAGAGGAQFPNPDFNGNIYILPRTGGTAQLMARIPFSQSAVFSAPFELFVNRGEASFTSSSVARLDLRTGAVLTVIANIPGASGGVGFDRQGNLYTGIGFSTVGRTGEIRRFSRQDVNQALHAGVPLDFGQGQFVVQSLSATGLLFDQQGDLWVGGGDVFGGNSGYIEEIDPETGQVLRRVDPRDGDPDNGPVGFFTLAITDPRSCTLAASDFFDPARTVYFIHACD